MSQTNILLALFAGFLIGISHWLEAIGFYFRFVGSSRNLPSLGYSIHVQTATISRIGTLIAYPVIGYLLDTRQSYQVVLQMVAAYCVTYILLSLLTLRYSKNINLIEKIFSMLTKKFEHTDKNNNEKKYHLIPEDKINKLKLYSLISYLIMVGGLFLTYALCAMHPDYRATILMLGPLLTSAGTLFSVMMLDPLVSWVIDTSHGAKKAIDEIIIFRVNGSIFLLSISLLILIYV